MHIYLKKKLKKKGGFNINEVKEKHDGGGGDMGRGREKKGKRKIKQQKSRNIF